jgi:DnaK suppressor protein
MNHTLVMTSARNKLLARRETLSRSRAGNDTDTMALESETRGEERSQNTEIADVLVLLSDRQKIELGDLNAAIARIDAGTWGRCEKCHGEIASRRLKVQPEARTCMTCEG